MIRAIIVTPAAVDHRPARPRVLVPIDTISHVDELVDDPGGAHGVLWRKVGSPTALRVMESIDAIADEMNDVPPEKRR
jgi:hypothetical protein